MCMDSAALSNFSSLKLFLWPLVLFLHSCVVLPKQTSFPLQRVHTLMYTMFLDLRLRCFGIMTLLAFTAWLFALMTKGHWRHPRPPHCCELVQTFNLPMLCRHRLMLANLNENPRKSGMWGGGSHF